MTATFPLFKLHSANSRLSNLLPHTGSPLVSFVCVCWAGEGGWMGSVHSITERGGPVIKIRSEHFFNSTTGRKHRDP